MKVEHVKKLVTKAKKLQVLTMKNLSKLTFNQMRYPMISKMFMILMLLTVQPVLAARTGGESGGGGDTIVSKQTGEIISIADPMAIREVPFKRLKIPLEVKLKLYNLEWFLNSYNFNEKRFEALTNENNVDYRLVDELPNLEICKDKLQYKNLGDDSLEISEAACTAGKITWIKKSSYDKLLAKESKQELALLLVHEGLRRVPNLANDDLTAITNGLRKVAEIFEKQRSKDAEALSQDEQDSIQTMFETILFNGLNKEVGEADISNAKNLLANMRMTNFGGLVWNDSKIDPSAVIGIGARLGFQSVIGKNVTILSTEIDNVVVDIADDSSILLSTISNDTNGIVRIGKGAKIEHSTVSFFYPSELVNSVNKYNKTVVDIGSNVKIINSTIKGEFNFADNVTIKNSQAHFYETFLENNVTLINFKEATFMNNYLSSRLVLKENSTFDLENKIVCSSGNNNFVGGNTKKSTTKELVKMCSRY